MLTPIQSQYSDRLSSSVSSMEKLQRTASYNVWYEFEDRIVTAQDVDVKFENRFMHSYKKS